MAIKEEDKKKGISSLSQKTMFQSTAPITGNITPAETREQMKEGPVQDFKATRPAWSSQRGIGGEQIYKNTNVDPKKYGQAIYSDTALGALPSGFDKDIKNYGIGATGLDAEGQSTGTYTPFSQPVQSPEMQQKAGGIEMAGVNPVGAGSPYGQNQYGNVGQGTNGITVIGQGGAGDWWNKPRNQRGGAFGQAQKIMDRMPYGSPGDRAERKSQLEQARVLMGMGISQARNQTAANRLAYEQQFGAEKLSQEYGQAGIENELERQRIGISGTNADVAMMNAMKEGQPQAGRWKQGAGTPILDPEGYEAGTTPGPWVDTAVGPPEKTIAGSTNPATQGLPQDIPEAKRTEAEAIQSKFQKSKKTEADRKEANDALLNLTGGAAL